MKDSINELARIIRERESQMVIVHGNAYDKVRVPFGEKTLEYRDIVDFVATLSESQYPTCLVYNVFAGLRVVRGNAAEMMKIMGVEKQKDKDNQIAEAMEMMKKARGDFSGDFPVEPEKLFPLLNVLLRKQAGTLLVIDHADAVIPVGIGATVIQARERALAVGVADWARDELINQNGNLVVLVARNNFDLNELVRDRIFGAVQVRICKPDEDERKMIFLESGQPETRTRVYARHAGGLSFRDLEKLRVSLSGLSDDDVISAIFREKKKIFTSEYGDLIEIAKARFGFEAVGGLEKLIAELRLVCRAMRDGDTVLVPQGIILFGPPGTGKTLIAEAMAREAGVNFFKLLDLKSMYVGESERRTTRAHNALREYAPGVVFVDEIDQKQRQRGGFDGDSGVSSGLFGKMLEIMSDTSLRGRVLWIFASNRPDLLDPAFKRDGRCDMRVPVLHPDAKQLERICEVARVQYPEIRSEVKSWSPHVEKCKGYNGATMIEVVRRAFVHAKRSGRDVIRDDDMVWACADYRPRLLDQKMIAQMNLLSILECSSNSLLPDNWKQVENESCEVLGIKNSGDATTDSSGLPVKLTGLN